MLSRIVETSKDQQKEDFTIVDNLQIKDKIEKDGKLVKGKILLNDIWYDIKDSDYVKEPEEYNELTVSELSIEDIQKLVDRMLAIEPTVIESIPKYCYTLDGNPLNGLYKIILRGGNVAARLGYFINGESYGPGILYNKHNKICCSGIFLNKLLRKGYKRNRDDTIYTGTFFKKNNKTYASEGQVTTYYPKLGLTIKNYLINCINSGVNRTTLREQDFWIEGQDAIISKTDEHDKYATIKLIDCSIKIKLNDKNLDNKARILFDNGCYFDGVFDSSDNNNTLLNYSKDNQWYLMKIDGEFSFPEEFTNADFEKMGVFGYKCLWMSQFPHMADIFYKYFKKNPTKEQLVNLKEKDYLEMGLTKLQYHQMISWLDHIANLLI